MTRGGGQNGFENDVFPFPGRGVKRASNIRKTATRVFGLLLLLLRRTVFLTFTTAAVPSKRFMGFLTRNRRRSALVRLYNFRLISENRWCLMCVFIIIFIIYPTRRRGPLRVSQVFSFFRKKTSIKIYYGRETIALGTMYNITQHITNI